MIYFLYNLFTLLLMTSLNRFPDLYKKYFYFSAVVIFTIIFGFRDPSLGTDTVSYIDIFHQPDGYREFWFGQFVHLTRSLGFTPETFIFIMTFLVVFTLHYGYYKWHKRDLLILLYFVSSTYMLYSFSLNIMRQGIAISLSILSAYYLYKRKYFFSIVGVLLSLVFHSSAIFAIPALLVSSFLGRQRLNIYNLLFLYSTLAFFILFPIVDVFQLFAKSFLSDTFVGVTILNYFKKTDPNPWFTFSSIFIIVVFNFYWMSAKRIEYSEKVHFLVNYYFIGFISCSPFIYMHLVYYRLAWYFMILEPLILLLIFTHLFVYLKQIRDKDYIKRMLEMIMIIFPFLYMFKTYFLTGGIMRAVDYGTSIF
ncbi:EpsG family protein [Vibrio sp. G41H]|uniref:EpsG family protein n=1 Tax=unclassified Vibrio TaxID=2614977 RepID=UPI001AD6F779|nr:MULTISPECIES: EpsG family protein [unclassified Vibrio]MBO7913688.1 EpsG family protein [Vibrio sp. G41H]MCF7492623.1 EpsG family protein [Vibrio sp. G-C-1]